MKKVCLMPALFVCLFTMKAQPQIPVLTDWNINPTVGQSFGYHSFYGVGFSPGSAGSQVNWNFNSVITLGHFVETYVTPASTGWDTAFPSANIALQRSAGSYLFFNYGATGQTNYGEASGTSHNAYYDGEDFLNLPFTFTNAYSDSFHSFTNGVYRYGNLSITADAYGSLTMPTATYPKVLRVHFQERLIDSTTVVINDQTTDLYKWYVPWIHSPVFVHGYTTNGATPNYHAFYLDSASAIIGLQEKSNAEMMLNVFPNPSSGIVTVSYHQKIKQNTTVILSNPEGALIRNWNFGEEWGNVNHEIDLSDLKKGIYFIQIDKGYKRKLIIN